MHPLKGRKQTPEHIAKRVYGNSLTIRKLRDTEIKLKKKVKIVGQCWVWIGSINKKPYGSYGEIRMGRRCNNKLMRAHRVSYEYFVEAIPTGYELDHLCRNTLCINPEHLEPVTHRENMKRGELSKKRKFS